jgi:hypothetical protein
MARRQRLGVRISRGWTVLLVLALALAGGAYWLGPMQEPPPTLELVLLADGEPATAVSVDGVTDAAEGVLRFPVQVALINTGTRAMRPQQIALHVPARFRLASARGRLNGEVAQGVPLRRYVLPVRPPQVEPGAPPMTLPGLDTLWLEPDLPRFYCVAQLSDVPEFVPAPQYDPQALAHLQIFYSVRSGAQRNTGLLDVNVDPRRLAITPAEMPPTFPTTFEEPQAQVPELGALRYGGSRTAWCGDPERPLELFVVTWLTGASGRFYVIHVGGQPRKILYDLNGDDVVELETWDVTGDGRFEARRQARFPVPEFLRPLPSSQPDVLLPDSLRPDSAWLALFRNTSAGPLRFTRRPPERATTPEGVPIVGGVAMDPLPPPDSAWLELFLNTGAGPFRFTRGTRRAPAESPVVQQRDTADADPSATDPAAPGTPQPTDPQQLEPAPEDTAGPAPPPVRRAPRPLGTPVPPPRQ